MIDLAKELSDTYQEISRSEDFLLFRIRISPQWSYFAGHFPLLPVLPAVALVDISQYFAEKLLSPVGNYALTKVMHFRIKNPVLPEEEIQIHVQREPKTMQFHVLWKGSEAIDKIFADISLEVSQH